MIRQRETIEDLARDPDVQKALALVPRNKTKQEPGPLPPEPGKVRMKEFGPRVVDAEHSLKAAHNNIARLEHELEVVRGDVGRLAQMILKRDQRGLTEDEMMFALRKEAQR